VPSRTFDELLPSFIEQAVIELNLEYQQLLPFIDI
jgi:hypothetical protein